MLLLPNGDFESGATVWTEFSLQGFSLILQTPDFPRVPHSGSWAAWLAGGNDEISQIEQTVTVPTEAPIALKYWHWIDSFDDCGFDFAFVRVDGTTTLDQYDLCSFTSTGTWALHTVDLTAYSGQTVTLQIRAETDSNAISSLFIDDVFFDFTLPEQIFSDGFESGDASAWSSNLP